MLEELTRTSWYASEGVKVFRTAKLPRFEWQNLQVRAAPRQLSPPGRCDLRREAGRAVQHRLHAARLSTLKIVDIPAQPTPVHHRAIENCLLISAIYELVRIPCRTMRGVQCSACGFARAKRRRPRPGPVRSLTGRWRPILCVKRSAHNLDGIDFAEVPDRIAASSLTNSSSR